MNVGSATAPTGTERESTRLSGNPEPSPAFREIQGRHSGLPYVWIIRVSEFVLVSDFLFPLTSLFFPHRP